MIKIMLDKHLFILLALLIRFFNCSAQFSDVRGVVTDDKEPVAVAYVKLLKDNVTVKQANVSPEGSFIFSELPIGNYNLEVRAMGFKMYKISFQLSSDESNFLSIRLISSLVDTFGTATIVAQREIKDDPPVEGKKIIEGPYNGIGGILVNNPNLTIVRGRLQSSDARAGQLSILHHGVTQLGPLTPATFSLGQVRVVANGVPAMYGDFVGGAIEYTNATYLDTVSKRNVLFRSSSPFNSYHQNAAETFLYKPLIVEEGNTKLAFTHSLFIGYQNDPNPTISNLYKLSDTALKDLLQNPFTETGNVSSTTAPHNFREENFEKIQARENVDAQNIYTSAGISWKPQNDLLITLAPSVQYTRAKQFLFSNSLLNANHNPLNTSLTGKINAQISHTLKQPYDKRGNLIYDNTLFSKINYGVTADYQHFHSEIKDPVYKDDIFSYGHVGLFSSNGQDNYRYVDEEKVVTDQFGNSRIIRGFYEWLGYQNTGLAFNPNTENEFRSSITEYVFETDQVSTLAEVSQNQGLLNGQNPTAIYGMWNAPGAVVSNYAKNDVQKASLNAILNVSMNPKKTLANQHDIQIGLLFEQRKYSFYNLDANSLWRLMPQLVNNQFYLPSQSTAELSFDENGMFTDTVNYSYSSNLSSQSTFDKSIREKISSDNGYISGGAHFIDINELSPEFFTLNMFSADELWNNGSSVVSYAGYDYLGNKQKGRFSISDFLNDPDKRSIGGHSPNYTAMWIQDKFVLEKLKIRAGLRVERYDANQLVLNDPYSLYPIRTKAEVNSFAGNQIVHPNNISDNAKVYVNDLSSPSHIVGYREGSQWYDENGVELSGGEKIRQESTNGVIQPLLIDINNQGITSETFRDYAPELILLPRLSISFPVTTTGLFYAYYDKFAQRPSFTQSFTPINTYYFLENSNTTLLPNSALRQTKRTDYQLGYKQMLGQFSTINLMVGYADIRDDINLIHMEQAYPRSYFTYGNIDFSTVKKFQVEYALNKKVIDLGVSYLLQYADGTGSNANSASSLLQAGQPNLRSLYPLAYDVRHKLNTSTTIDLSVLSSKTKSIFSNAQLNIYSNTTSGLPFTAYATPVPEAQNLGTVSRSQIKGNPFGSRMPWNYNVDLSVSKVLLFRSKPVVLQLNVLNVLNIQNIQNVYAATASATNDGYLSSPVGQQEIAREQNAISFVQNYNLKLNNPNHFGAPRTISLTLRTSF